MGLDRWNGHTQNLGHLPVTEPSQVVEDDYLLLSTRQSPQPAGDINPSHAFTLKRWLGGGWVLVSGPRFLAQHIDRQIRRDPGHPRMRIIRDSGPPDQCSDYRLAGYILRAITSDKTRGRPLRLYEQLGYELIVGTGSHTTCLTSGGPGANDTHSKFLHGLGNSSGAMVPSETPAVAEGPWSYVAGNMRADGGARRASKEEESLYQAQAQPPPDRRARGRHQGVGARRIGPSDLIFSAQ